MRRSGLGFASFPLLAVEGGALRRRRKGRTQMNADLLDSRKRMGRGSPQISADSRIKKKWEMICGDLRKSASLRLLVCVSGLPCGIPRRAKRGAPRRACAVMMQ